MNAAHAVGDDTLQEQAYGYRYQIALPTELPSNACAGSNGATSMEICNTAIPLACQIVNFINRGWDKVLASQLFWIIEQDAVVEWALLR